MSVPTRRIWQHQDSFAYAYRDKLDSVLELLSADLTTSLFLVGVNLTDGKAVISPQKQAPIKPRELADNFNDLIATRVLSPDDVLSPKRWRQAYRKYDKYLWKCHSDIKAAVEGLFDPTLALVFASPPCEVNNHAICAIALLNREQYHRYPHLDDDLYQQTGRWPSLIWAAVETVLDDAAAELQKRNAGAMMEWKHSDPRELLRTAATLFARRHAWAGPRFSPVDIMKDGVYDLFDAATIISSTRYEQHEGVGDLVITD